MASQLARLVPCGSAHSGTVLVSELAGSSAFWVLSRLHMSCYVYTVLAG